MILAPASFTRRMHLRQSTLCLSADLATRITPCQFGGPPVCSERGCLVSAGMIAIGRHKLAGIVTVADVFSMSRRLGEQIAGFRPPSRPLAENRQKRPVN
jgi:hypothetical protein